jgi:Fe-S-cluster containining protein
MQLLKGPVNRWVNNKIFNCDKCGICCTKLNLSDIYADLDTGNGVCKYFDVLTKLCSIYENRPDRCNIIVMYKYFEQSMTFKEYIEMNEQGCQKLKEM